MRVAALGISRADCGRAAGHRGCETCPVVAVRSTLRAGHALAVLCIVAVAYLVTPTLFDLDDAYIPLYAAQAALGGADPVYGSAVLAGATSPAYVALLIATMAIGIRGLLALRVVSALGLAAYVFALWRLGVVLKLSVQRTIVLIVLTLGSGLVLMQATNGLETGWALALLTLLIAEAMRQNPYATAAGAGALPFLRPDLAPAAVLLLVYAGREHGWRQRLNAAALALATAVPLLLWIRVDTGAWIPQTMQAKQLFFAEMCGPFTAKSAVVLVALSNFLVVVAPISISAVALWRHRLGSYGLLAVALTLAAFAIRFPGGLSHNSSRYLYALLIPWLSLGAALRLSRGGLLSTTPFLAVLVVATVAVWPLQQPLRADAAVELRTAAEWVDRNVPGDATLLVHDAGAISMFAHRRAVDLVGLKTLSSIDAHRRWTSPSCGRDRAKAVAEIAAASHASYMVVLSRWDEIFQLRSGLEANGFVVDPVRLPPPSNEGGYTIYKIARHPASM